MATKPMLHPRNQHRDGYNFARLLKATPELEPFVTRNPRGEMTIDFANAEAVRMLNRALLAAHYDVKFWEFPDTYLCPPIPGRVDYIHSLADLLAEDNGGDIPRGDGIKVLDIGTGASLVYPLIGQHEYGWNFTGVDIDQVSIKAARQINERNGLNISLRHQKNPKNVFRGVIHPRDTFHLTMCNPPFHSSLEQAGKGTERKWRNLGKEPSAKLNFGGQNAELWCPGGEIGFIGRMVEQSVEFAEQCLWFTTLVSKKDNLRTIDRFLSKTGVAETKTVEMAQGQKTSRFVAWTFYSKKQRAL